MKPRKHKRMNDYLKSLEATQEIRINECGSMAYQDYTRPKELGTMFSNRFKEVIKRQMI